MFNDVDVDKSEFIDYEEFHTVFQGFHYENVNLQYNYLETGNCIRLKIKSC